MNNAKVEADKLNSIYSKYWRETDSFRATADQMKSAYFEKMKDGSLTNEQAVRHQELFDEFIVKLTDFDVSLLLDFWASWCIPCRKENPRYLEIYNKYKDRNFQIVAVSLNRANEKEAWHHLSDLQGYKSPIYQLYEVKGLPQSYLINEKGEIIGHNLKGIELEQKLALILK